MFVSARFVDLRAAAFCRQVALSLQPVLRGRSAAAVLALASAVACCIAANWLNLIANGRVEAARRDKGAAGTISSRVLEVIEEEIDKATSPHSKIAALENSQILRYADEFDLIQRMPRHLFAAFAAICRGVCSKKCAQSQDEVFHRSATCRCKDAFHALHNISVADHEWGEELAAIDIDQQGKMMEVCSGLMTCRSILAQGQGPSACSAQAETILQEGKRGGEGGEGGGGAGEEAHAALRQGKQVSDMDGERAPPFQEMALRAGAKSMRQLFDYVATVPACLAACLPACLSCSVTNKATTDDIWRAQYGDFRGAFLHHLFGSFPKVCES